MSRRWSCPSEQCDTGPGLAVLKELLFAPSSSNWAKMFSFPQHKMLLLGAKLTPTGGDKSPVGVSEEQRVTAGCGGHRDRLLWE